MVMEAHQQRDEHGRVKIDKTGVGNRLHEILKGCSTEYGDERNAGKGRTRITLPTCSSLTPTVKCFHKIHLNGQTMRSQCHNVPSQDARQKYIFSRHSHASHVINKDIQPAAITVNEIEIPVIVYMEKNTSTQKQSSFILNQSLRKYYANCADRKVTSISSWSQLSKINFVSHHSFEPLLLLSKRAPFYTGKRFSKKELCSDMSLSGVSVVTSGHFENDKAFLYSSQLKERMRWKPNLSSSSKDVKNIASLSDRLLNREDEMLEGQSIVDHKPSKLVLQVLLPKEHAIGRNTKCAKHRNDAVRYSKSLCNCDLTFDYDLSSIPPPAPPPSASAGAYFEEFDEYNPDDEYDYCNKDNKLKNDKFYFS